MRSLSYKLKLNGGDIKSVQGDSGHAQVKMVTDVYSHILDDDRRNNAKISEMIAISFLWKLSSVLPVEELKS